MEVLLGVLLGLVCLGTGAVAVIFCEKSSSIASWFSRLPRRIAWMDKQEALGKIAVGSLLLGLVCQIALIPLCRDGASLPTRAQLFLLALSFALILFPIVLTIVFFRDTRQRKAQERRFRSLLERWGQSCLALDEIRSHLSGGYRDPACDMSSRDELRAIADGPLKMNDRTEARRVRIVLDRLDALEFDLARARFHDGADVPPDVPLQPEELEARAVEEAKVAASLMTKTSQS